MKQTNETIELKEKFSMLTFQELTRKYNIPKEMNLQEVIPFEQIKLLIQEVRILKKFLKQK